ncbi:MAG: UTP--glucose-1-phosphate uridylyltransferase [Chlamydiia bacterium]|nr:UTP--glucose-1-phosphate uridylyltransferase [Chlamydiia bacterium]
MTYFPPCEQPLIIWGEEREIVSKEVVQVEEVCQEILKRTNQVEKNAFLLDLKQVKEGLKDPKIGTLFSKLNGDEVYVGTFLSVLAIFQQKVLFAYADDLDPDVVDKRFKALMDQLVTVEKTYLSLGGVIGYHAAVKRLLAMDRRKIESRKISRASGPDIGSSNETRQKAVIEGLRLMPELAEIYPIGGLGSRLGLRDRFGIPLPAAALKFGGRTLLEGLLRDLEAREYLYYKVFGHEITTPIAMMTSHEKHNHLHIKILLEQNQWFDRKPETFFLFVQPSVPVLTEKGEWVMRGDLELYLQPGGHGAIWQVASQEGVFDWFAKLGRKVGVIRQINNPIAGVDDGLLAFTGVGHLNNKVFGLASCDRLVQTAEGMLVLSSNQKGVTLSNIEYTDFKAQKIEDCPVKPGSSYSCYPANTNIIYVDFEKIAPYIAKQPLPGLMINMKTKLDLQSSKTGRINRLACGRLESMMQNISDELVGRREEELPTFLTYNSREKTISTVKQSYFSERSMVETPVGAYYDLLKNGHTLLKNHCKVKVPPFSKQYEYLENGPSVLFVYRPALGPLWDVIGQKIVGGEFMPNCELNLEIVDLKLFNLVLDGSLLIEAKNPLGRTESSRFGCGGGRAILENVVVTNLGIDRRIPQTWWKNEISRLEACMITLEGNGEIILKNIALEGNQMITVPDGERWTAKGFEEGKVVWIKEKITNPAWEWKYALRDNAINLELVENSTDHKLFSPSKELQTLAQQTRQQKREGERSD